MEINAAKQDITKKNTVNLSGQFKLGFVVALRGYQGCDVCVVLSPFVLKATVLNTERYLPY